MNNRRFLRGVLHCHSRNSYDSLISISTYLDFARRQSLDFIVLTDHDTIAGSVELRQAAAKAMPRLQVPIAAEYHTDEGDLIAMFLQREVAERSYEDFVRSVHSQKGLLLLPHPFVGHRNPERLANDCDLIEVYNSRAAAAENNRAAELANKLSKPRYGASDAHLARSLAYVIMQVEDRGELKRSFLEGEIRWTERVTPRWEYASSQLTKAWKRRDPGLVLSLAKSAFRAIFRRMRGVQR